jgi:hypothetical protein
MYLLEISKNGLTLERSITLDNDSYKCKYKKLGIDLKEFDISLIMINVNYESLVNNKFLTLFDISELKINNYILVTRHLYKILKYNY